MDVFDLVAKITLDSSEYDKGLGEAGNSAQTFGSKIKGGIANAGKVAGAAVAAVATAATAMTGAIAAGISQTAAYGDSIDKMSQKLGMSATAYQEWDAVMQHAGTSIDSMQASMKTLASAAETGNKAFETLGFTQEELASMSQEELFANTLTALQNVDDETQRTYLAGQLLGRGATELGPLLNMTADETQNLKDRVHEIGGVMSDEAVAAAAAYQDSLQDLQTSFGGLQRNMLSQFMPAITTVMDGLTNLFAGNGGIEQISEGVGQFVDTLSGIIPDVLATGSQILLALGSAITENLPVLVDAAIQTITTLGTGLIENLPMLVDAGLQILLSLSQSIGDNLPTLIPTIVDVILQIVNTLTDPANLSALANGAIAIIMGLANGLIAALPQLIAAAPTIIANLVTALIQNVPLLLQAGHQAIVQLVTGLIQALPQMAQSAAQIVQTLNQGITTAFSSLVAKGAEMIAKVKEGVTSAIQGATQWGRDLISNFISGITEKISNLRASISNVASTIKSLLGFSEPEEGPLSDFHTYAPDMMQLFAQGVKDNEDVVRAQIERSFNFGDVGTISGTPTVGTISDSGILTVMQDMVSAIQNMGIYMDTGTLVGQVSPGVDENMGGRYNYAQRGLAV